MHTYMTFQHYAHELTDGSANVFINVCLEIYDTVHEKVSLNAFCNAMFRRRHACIDYIHCNPEYSEYLHAYIHDIPTLRA